MLSSNSLCALLAVLASQALADSTTCYTAMTSKDPGGYVPTQWTTDYKPCTSTITSYVHKTITPKVTKTDTDTFYTTIKNPQKGTSTTVTTKTKKTSTLITTTSTVTASTTTTITSTSTAPAPAMFTPIQSSLPGSSNGTLAPLPPAMVRRYSRKDIMKRDSPPGYYNTGKSYPKSVTCHMYKKSKQCSTTTVTKTKKITAYPTTVHTKTTTTITSTECPGAKTTVTSTYTTTKTSTITTGTITTSTSTATQIAGTKTVNAACLSSANYANQVSGKRIVEADPLPTDRAASFVQFQTENEFSCCNAAFAAPGTYQAVPGVEIFAFDMRRQNTSDPTSPIIGFCSLFGSPTTCAATQAGGQWQILNEDQAPPLGPNDPVQDTVTSPTLGNAACGEGVGPAAE